MAVGIPIGISIGKTKRALADAIEDTSPRYILVPYADSRREPQPERLDCARCTMPGRWPNSSRRS
jgi:hypothetical protein